jgi:hypothetical protein
MAVVVFMGFWFCVVEKLAMGYVTYKTLNSEMTVP